MNSKTLPWPLVETAWLAEHLDHGDLRVVECSVIMKSFEDGTYTFVGARDEWAEGHIPGSAFVDPLTELKDDDNPLPMMLPPKSRFAAVMSGLGVGQGARVVLYDRSNHAWAARVWWMLRVFGFDEAAVLNGGWRRWLAEDRPVSRTPSSYPRAEFKPQYRSELVADKQEVLESLPDEGKRVVHALSPEEFRGTAKTSFPRAGRIKGSVNVFCQSLVDPERHTYLPPEALRERFEAAGALGGNRTITYCGGGIAATSDALALAVLGVPNVAVYDGSLAEWTADPNLPMETG